MRTHLNLRARCQRGQAMVEFSLSIMIFVVLLMGIFDVGRAIFMYNGVSEAAREIARRTSVYTFDTIAGLDYLGSSPETRAVVAIQQGLIPGMNPVPAGPPNFECVDIAGDLVPDPDRCGWGATEGGIRRDYVRVTVTATYQPITLLGIIGPITLQSTSTVAIPTNHG